MLLTQRPKRKERQAVDAQFRKPSFSDWDWNNGSVLIRRRNGGEKKGEMLLVRWLNLQAISVHDYPGPVHSNTRARRPRSSISELVLASLSLAVCVSHRIIDVILLFLTGSLINRLGLHGGLESNILSRWWMQPRFNEASVSWPWKRVTLVELHLLNGVWNWSWYSESQYPWEHGHASVKWVLYYLEQLQHTP